TYPANNDEAQKVLGAIALQGPPILTLDNLDQPFGGAAIEAYLTVDECVQPRILGQSRAPEVRWRTVIFATGNNIETLGDTTRRVIVCRLEPRVENPEDRTDFKYKDLR